MELQSRSLPILTVAFWNISEELPKTSSESMLRCTARGPVQHQKKNSCSDNPGVFLHTCPGSWSSRDETLRSFCPHFPPVAKVTFSAKHTPLPSPGNKHESSGRGENDTDNAHRGPGRHARVSKIPSASLEVMSVWLGALEVCNTVVLKVSQQMASVAQRQNMPIISWNPFIFLLYVQTDWEQNHLVQMNEPASPNIIFLSTGAPPPSMGRIGNSLNSLIVFLVY